jgi:hypothetical protein
VIVVNDYLLMRTLIKYLIALCALMTWGVEWIWAQEPIISTQSNHYLTYKTRSGLVDRYVIGKTEVSYKYKNTRNQTIESFFGVVDINLDAKQGITDSERRKVEAFKALEVGKSLTIYHFGDSGFGAWTRTVKIEVKGRETIKLADKVYDTTLIVGTVTAPRTYNFDFQCWYSSAIGSCIKAKTVTDSLRALSENGDNLMELINYELPAGIDLGGNSAEKK